MNPALILALVPRIWPAVAGAAGAIYFVSQHDYATAFTVLTTGLGIGHVLANQAAQKS